MANLKISELTALLGANVADDDLIAIVDTDGVATKKIRADEFQEYILDPDTVLTELNNAAGTLASSLHGWWRDTTSNEDDYPFVQTGVSSVNAGTAVAFDLAFTSAPRVATGVNQGNACRITSFTAVTVNGFTGSGLTCGNVNQATSVHWNAIGRKT